MALTKPPLSMLDVSGGLTMRNRVINGCCRVTQRSSVSLTTSNQFGTVDRMMGSYVNGSAGTLTQLVGGNAAGMTFKRGVHFSGVSLSSGYITFRHRIEALNTLDLSGQTVTVSAKIYHDYGSSTNFKIGLRKASASDNFSSTSAIGTDTTVAVASATNTTVSGTYTLGSTDGDNGIEIVIYHDAATVTTKNVVIGDIQLTLGSEVEQLERRPIGTELALCQRYLPAYVGYQTIGSGICYASTIAGVQVKFPVTARVTPTGISVSAATDFNLRKNTGAGEGSTAITFNSWSTEAAQVEVTVASGLVQGNATILQAANGNAKLLFTGCEL